MKRNFRRALSLMLALSIAAPCLAAEGGAGLWDKKAKAPKAAEAAPAAANFKISFRLKSADMEKTGNFVIAEGEQANYLVGGEFTRQALDGKETEPKKYGTIVNCLVKTVAGARSANAQCQFELSGPVQGKAPVVFQLQTSFVAPLGRPLVLVDEPERLVEIKIDLL